MLYQIFIHVGHLYNFPPQNTKKHVYEHRQAVDVTGVNTEEQSRVEERRFVKGREDDGRWQSSKEGPLCRMETFSHLHQLND